MLFGRTPSLGRYSVLESTAAYGHVSRIFRRVLSQLSNGQDMFHRSSRYSRGCDREESCPPFIINSTIMTYSYSYRNSVSDLHIHCCAPTCADDVAVLAATIIYLQIIACVVYFYICREHYTINASKSAEVDLNEVVSMDEGEVTLGGEKIGRSSTEVHL